MDEVHATVPDECQHAVSDQMEADGGERARCGNPMPGTTGENSHPDDGDDGNVVEAGKFSDQLPDAFGCILQQRRDEKRKQRQDRTDNSGDSDQLTIIGLRSQGLIQVDGEKRRGAIQ